MVEREDPACILVSGSTTHGEHAHATRRVRTLDRCTKDKKTRRPSMQRRVYPRNRPRTRKHGRANRRTTTCRPQGLRAPTLTGSQLLPEPSLPRIDGRPPRHEYAEKAHASTASPHAFRGAHSPPRAYRVRNSFEGEGARSPARRAGDEPPPHTPARTRTGFSGAPRPHPSTSRAQRRRHLA